MLAPIIMGIAILTGRPPATKPTIIEVTVLEDWTSAVASVPTINPIKGLVAKAKRLAAPSEPPVTHLKPVPIVPTARSIV
jgi:hypothetical protein